MDHGLVLKFMVALRDLFGQARELLLKGVKEYQQFSGGQGLLSQGWLIRWVQH